MNRLRAFFAPTEISLARYLARLALVVLQIVLAYCLAGQTNPFFYQAF